jgi:hypothetical protein
MVALGGKGRDRAAIRYRIALAVMPGVAAFSPIQAAPTPSVEDLRSLSIEDLGDLEIISVSRRAVDDLPQSSHPWLFGA